jgi:multifunctional methyltransferase subunit TRM112
MKIITLNFLTCARKACKPSATSFPLHPKDAELEIAECDFNPQFLSNILPRLEWPALKTLCLELGLPGLVDEVPAPNELWVPDAMPVGELSEVEPSQQSQVEEPAKEPSQLARDLHRLLLETTIQEGKLICGNCGHEYAVKEGIANFLLPPHLV